MRKLILITLILTGLQLTASAQITKADVEQMMSETGLTFEKMESLLVYNTRNYSGERSWLSWTHAKKNSDSYELKYALTETGILYKAYKEGKIKIVELFPFSAIQTIKVFDSSITIYLRE